MMHYVLHDKMDMPGKGQDFVLVSMNPDRKYSLAILADGVSSAAGAALGASLACNQMLNYFNEAAYLSSPLMFDYSSGYAAIAKQLSEISQYSSSSHDSVGENASYATTLITACISTDTAQFSFVGNGAILEIRNQWFELDEENMFQFGISDYLNPHIKLRGSETPLYKSIKAGIGNSFIKPDVITVQSDLIKDSFFLICSDGLHSREESTLYYNKETNDYFRQQNPRLVSFLKLLKQNVDLIKSDPEKFKEAFRKEIEEKIFLQDDLSYALFIP